MRKRSRSNSSSSTKSLSKFTGDSKTWQEIPDVVSSCKNYKSLPCNFKEDIESAKRIGTESQDAEVYHYTMGDCDVAVKLLIPVNKNSQGSIKQEIRFAKRASKYVLTHPEQPQHFLIVISSKQCNNIYLEQDTKLKINGQKFAVLEDFNKFMEDQVSLGIVKRISYKRFNMTHDYENEPIEYLLAASEQFGYEIHEVNIKGYLLMSEMVWGDLKSFIKTFQRSSHFDEYMVYIISEIFQAIKEMNVDLKILHGDLHTGNVLIKIDTDMKMHVLIHDFGKSERNTSPGMFYYDDIRRILEGIVSLITGHEQLEERISIILNSLSDIQSYDELKEVWDSQNIVQKKTLKTSDFTRRGGGRRSRRR